MSEQLVEVPQVFTRVLQVLPPLVERSIWYAVTAEPPLSAGAVQRRLICVEDTAVAARPVGGDGATERVVADAVLDGEPVPAELMAETL